MRRGEAGGSGCRAHLARQLRVARCPLSVRASLAPGLSHPTALARKRGPPPSQPVPARRALPAASGSGLPGATAALRSQQSGVARQRPGGPFQSALRSPAVRCCFGAPPSQRPDASWPCAAALSAHSCLPRGSPQARAVSVRPGIAHSRGSAPRSALGKGHEPPPVPLSHAPPQPGKSCCYFNLQSVDAEHTTLHSLALVKPVTSHQKRDCPPHPPPSAREPRGHRPRGRSLPSVSL